MDPHPAHLRNKKKQITLILQSSRNLTELSQKLVDTSQSILPGPKLNSNKIESKSGDTGELLDSGNLQLSSERHGQSLFSQTFTQSGSLLNYYCAHVPLTQEIENLLFEQIKQGSKFEFENICQKKCKMKFNPAYSNLHENQVIELKYKLQKKKEKKIKVCDGQGCEFYFILNDQLPLGNYYCPLCLDYFELKI